MFREQLTRYGSLLLSNIAEDHEHSPVENTIRFLYSTKTSCGERRTQIYIGREVGYITRSYRSAGLKKPRQLQNSVRARFDEKNFIDKVI